MSTAKPLPTREQLLHALYEAAELEHDLMCTYLYAAFSLRTDPEDGLSEREADAVKRWRSTIMKVAIEEMGHLVAVWNITAALGGSPRFGRGNFPLDPGMLPAGVVVKLAPFNEAVLQHFIHLERPLGSSEPDGDGFAADWSYKRSSLKPRVTPMAVDYDTVGEFYAMLGENLQRFVDAHSEQGTFCGDPALQLSQQEVELHGAKPVLCAKTALAAFQAIVLQGEGAPQNEQNSHFRRFVAIREELAELKAANPDFKPAFPAAVNPVLRPPMRPQGRVWLEHEEAAASVDVANASYGLMLRLLAYAYTLPRPAAEKSLAVDLGIGLMRAVTHLAEHAARLPAGPSNPDCHAGMSFVILRDSAPLLPGESARRFFLERFEELTRAAGALPDASAPRVVSAIRVLRDLERRAQRGFAEARSARLSVLQPEAKPAASATASNPLSSVVHGVEVVEGRDLTLHFEAQRCIHARFCVTGAPDVFLANVQGPWIHPDAMPVESLVAIAHACPSGAIRYERKDGRPNESAPPVNLLAVREAGPYAVRGEMRIDGESVPFRATLCRCGASKHKPYCDGSHHEVQFSASGEPPTGQADMLPVRNGPLAIDPETDGPLRVRGNLEITSGTGRVVARVTSAKLCRCGGSANKPFCDGTHARIGFTST